ncbi:MAG: alpha/beta hydrolase [Nitriliruptor sp.]|nr:MAG: alpha/beta hydrolase [Nitriliruptor sp.]
MSPSTTDTRVHSGPPAPAPGAGGRLGRTLAPLLAVVALVAACDDDPDEAVDAFTEDPDCFGIELVELEADEVRCGTVTAPLHHDDPDGERVTLAVATLLDEDASGEPVLVLGGGPGEVVVETVLTDPMAQQLFAFEGREVILLDQRGVGSSEPELVCEAFDSEAFTDIPDEQEQRDALTACRAELVDRGVDLDAFDHTNNARDVDLVRRALGHDQLVLRGGSYGSHLALHAAALAPDAFSALVLSSPVDPTVNYLQAGPGGFQSALDRLDDACSQDERCNEHLGDVHHAIAEVADRLTDQPEEVTAEPLNGGEPITRTFTGEVFLGAVFGAFYAPDGGFALPGMLIAARDGDLEPLASLAATIDEGLDSVPRGMYLSMVCAGEGASYDAEVAAAGLRSPALMEHWFDQLGIGGRDTATLCELWDVAPSFEPGELELATDVPTLLVTGEVDHVTPPVLGQQLHEQLTTSHLVEARGLAHGPLEGLDALAAGCGSAIVAAFLDDPGSEPNSICARQIPPLDAIGQFLQ